MKIILSIALLMLTINGFAQTANEETVTALSSKVFTWEVDNKIDSIADVFDEKFMAFTSSGDKQNREKYLSVLRSGSVIHNSIEIEETTASVVNNTATVAGKGKFTITVNGNKRTIHLSYLEVFVRRDEQSPWKMLALHAGLLPK
jgi:hypothetical protein